MPLLARKRVLLAKIESVYGTDSIPTGAANAILLRNMTITPQEADLVDRDLVRPYIGRSEQLPAGIRAMCEFEVEMAGPGTAGQAPGYGPLMRSCGFAETLLAAAVTGTCQAGSTSTTIVLAAGASSVDGFYVGMPVRTTAGTGSGQSSVITGYVGSTRTATVARPWTITPDNTTGYSVDANAVYRPTSGPTFDSSTLYFNVDGVLHRLTGARGNVQAQLNVKQIPVFKFMMTGIYNAVTDTAAPTPTYTGFQTPLPVTNTNTPLFNLHATNAILSELSIDLANAVSHRTLVNGTETVLITDREPVGNVSIEADTVAFRNWWSIAQNVTLGSLGLTHGLNAGNRVSISSPRVQLTKPVYSELDGIQMLGLGMNFVPSTVGNDEIAICAH